MLAYFSWRNIYVFSTKLFQTFQSPFFSAFSKQEMSGKGHLKDQHGMTLRDPDVKWRRTSYSSRTKGNCQILANPEAKLRRSTLKCSSSYFLRLVCLEPEEPLKETKGSSLISNTQMHTTRCLKKSMIVFARACSGVCFLRHAEMQTHGLEIRSVPQLLKSNFWFFYKNLYRELLKDYNCLISVLWRTLNFWTFSGSHPC